MQQLAIFSKYRGFYKRHYITWDVYVPLFRPNRAHDEYSSTWRSDVALFYVSWLVCLLTLCCHSEALASVWTSPPKLQGLEICCFFLKDALSIEDEKLFKACKSVCLLVPLQGKYPHQKCENFNTLHNFLIYYCRDFSHILHICTRQQVDSLVWVAALDLSWFF